MIHSPEADALYCDDASLNGNATLGVLLTRQTTELNAIVSFAGLLDWKDRLLASCRDTQSDAYRALDCLLFDRGELKGAELAQGFSAWQEVLVQTLRRLQHNGALDDTNDPRQLAIGLMAALQGGYLLAKLTLDATQLDHAIGLSIDHLARLAPE